MVITLTNTGSKKGTQDNTKLYFPVNPAQINYKGATYFQEYSILNKGPVKIPNGEEISTIGWECFFPGKNIQDLPFVRNKTIKKGKTAAKHVSPETLHKKLETWRKSGAKLKLNISGTPFSFWVYIDTYEANKQDAHGSIYYTIEFSKVVNVSVEKVAKKKKRAGKTTGNKRVSLKKKKYTVKKGDCLWNISKKFYKDPTKWRKIYNANKSVIEKTAKKHGFKSSRQGWWIFPGTSLKIP